MEYFYLKILKIRQNKFILIILLRQATLRMNVEQILRKESLDEILQMAKSSEGGRVCSDHQVLIVGTYLDLPMGSPSFYSQQQMNSEDFPQITLSIGHPPSSLDSSPPHPQTRPRKRSVFHNFQKHLMTTLRSSVQIRKSSHSDHSQSNIASQLWEYFKCSSQISKRFLLSLLFGRSSDNKQADSAYLQDYQRMVDEFNEYSEAELNTAQTYLYREVIRQSKKLIESKGFGNRRINQSGEFKSYFKMFIEELEGGRISKRLPKASKFLKNDIKQKENIQ